MKEELDTMGKSKLIKIAALLLVMTLAILALIPEQDADNKLSGKEKTQQILMEDAGKQMLGRKEDVKESWEKYIKLKSEHKNSLKIVAVIVEKVKVQVNVEKSHEYNMLFVNNKKLKRMTLGA